MDDWTEAYFERGYAQRWALGRPSEKTEHEVDALWALLGLGSGSSVLDVGCGHGGHSVIFAKRGAEVTGVDSSRALLQRAQSLASACAAEVSLVRGDMRQLPFVPAQFRAGIMFDAFGFFDRDEDHDGVLSELARVLVAGGRAALKVVNAEPILADFRATDVEERDGTMVRISRTLIDDPQRLVERISITGPHGGGNYERRQRLYTASELSAALYRAGLSVTTVLESAAGVRFDSATSPSMLFIGER